MNLNQKESTEILIKVSKHLMDGHRDKYENLIKKIDKDEEEKTLPKKLKEVYDKIGSTPIEEPEVYELSEKINKEEASIIDLVLRFLSEDDMDEFEIDEVAKFAGMIKRKVTEHKDKDGVFKQTPNTSEWQRPKPSHVKTYEKMIKEANKLKTDEEREKQNKKIEEFAYKTSGVDAEKLTEWEKALVIKQTREALEGYLNSYLGKS